MLHHNCKIASVHQMLFKVFRVCSHLGNVEPNIFLQLGTFSIVPNLMCTEGFYSPSCGKGLTAETQA